MGCCEAEKNKAICQITKNEDRGCTDTLCCLLFLGFWGVVLALMGYALGLGATPLGAIYGKDFNGNTCGVSSSVAAQPFTAWPYPLLPQMTVCVSSCNATSLSDSRFVVPYESTQYLKFCLPSILNSTFTSNADFNSVSAVATRAIGDLANGWTVIAIGAALAFVFALLYLKVVQCAGAILVWGALLLVLFGGACVSAICLQKSTDTTVTSGDPNKVYALQGVGIACAILTFLYFCAIVFMRNRINLAVKITQEASRALEDLKSAILFPVLPFVIVLGYFIWWIYTATLLFSVSTSDVTPYPKTAEFYPTGTYNPLFANSHGWPSYNSTSGFGYYTQSWNDQLKKAFCIHFFHLLWNVQFWIYFSFLVLSGAVSQWYFTPYNEKGEKPRGDGEGQLPDSPISASLWRTIRYHLGSVAFASLIIAIIQFIRAVILYFEQKAKDSGMNETLRKCIFCCVNCIMSCIECCVNQINRNGFVFVAVYGTPFCTSSCNAFAIAWANLGRVAWVTMCGDFLLGIGKVFISVCATGICGLILFSSSYGNSGSIAISSPAFLLVVIFILAWCIASVFMVVYETCVDTIFMCFLIDEDVNKQTGRYLAGKDLLAMINDPALQSEGESITGKIEPPASEMKATAAQPAAN